MIYISAHGSHEHLQTLNKWYYLYNNGILNTDEQLDLRYILYSKTFTPQCEVKIIVFIVLLIDANYAIFILLYYNVTQLTHKIFNNSPF
jgi:hypothetical protein